MEYFIHFSLSLLLLARWNHQKILRWVIFFVPRERADATKQYREIFFFVCIYYFLTSLSSSRGPILCIVGCVYGRLIAAAAADGNVCLLMLMPHRPGQNPKIPAALTSSYQPPDKRNIHVAYRRARAEMVAPSIIHRYTLMDLPHSWKGNVVVVVVFSPRSRMNKMREKLVT